MGHLQAVFSGPRATRDRACSALEATGFTVDERHGAHDWGHPSYRNHVEAQAAGKPNAGHTPGTPHPETGKDYAPDRRVSFVTVTTEAEDGLHPEMLAAAARALEPLGWVPRSHWRKILRTLSREQVRELRGMLAEVGRR